MSSVVELLEFKQRRETPTLVLVDLHRPKPGQCTEPPGDAATLARALAHCREALGFARKRNIPVAFIRHYDGYPAMAESRSYPRWLEGFEPGRMDMVFERRLPSCYASPEFAEMAEHINGNYVLAGLFGETSCLSTAIDAFHRNHAITYLADASASRSVKGVPAASVHDNVAAIVSIYVTVAATSTWIHATSQMRGGGRG